MADAEAAARKPAALDDIMIAMDVVDTIRHREDLVRRELNETGRETELIERLKAIYREQGIDVPEAVLAEGVKALKDSRFTYTPAPAGWKRTLFTIWAVRKRVGAVAAIATALVGGGYGVHYYNVVQPTRVVQEQARVELTETLPKAIRTAHADVMGIATEPAARARADQLLADGERSIRDRDRVGMTKVSKDLANLRDDLVREYTLTIVSRPGETSGVWRRPPAGSTARNYYLVVEAIAPDGRRLNLPIRNEETGATETVEKFGVRVPQAIFEAVAADKRDDGIIQKNKYAVKKRGTLSIEYNMPFEGGMITRW